MADNVRGSLHVDHHRGGFVSADYSARIASWNEVRSACPVAWNPNYGGFWLLTSYEAVSQVSRDTASFSHTHCPVQVDGIEYIGNVGVPRPPHFAHLGLGESDGQFHADARKALNPLFSPGRALAQRQYVRNVVDWFLDQVIESGRTEFIDDVIAPVTSIVTLHILGLPTGAWKDTSDVFHRLFGHMGDEVEIEHAQRVQAPALSALFLDTARRRREDPRDDVITRLATMVVEGTRVDDETLGQLIYNFVAGGVDTTTGFTGNALIHLQGDRELRERLIANPDILPQATEEFLRVYGSVPSLGRTVVRDAIVGGQALKRGDHVVIGHLAANMDPDEFQNPDEFQADRKRNRHLAFGASAHRCIGSHVARVVFQELITAILSRTPDYDLVTDEVITYSGSPSLVGVWRLPSIFTPGTPVGAPKEFADQVEVTDP